MIKPDNAVIMAAGTSSRFAPLSYEKPKALLPVKGEVLIERQIRQLQQAGISEIYIVVGYLAQQFSYLQEKFGVHIVENPDYLHRNNNGSIYAVKDILKNTYICSADNYFSENPFEQQVSECYYAAVYADGPTKEWCMHTDKNGIINKVEIGGENAWYMLGHTFWDEAFSRRFLEILEDIYHKPETVPLLWEHIYMANLDTLKMHIRKYSQDVVFEFDTLDELREFDETYIENTGSKILQDIAGRLGCSEGALTQLTAYKDESNEAAGFTFRYNGQTYQYAYNTKEMKQKNG